MHTLRFETNLHCGKCVNAVAPMLNHLSQNWQVDVKAPPYTLTIETELDAPGVVDAVRRAGFKAIEVVG